VNLTPHISNQVNKVVLRDCPESKRLAIVKAFLLMAHYFW